MRRPASILGALLVLLGAVALGACGVGAGDSDPEGATLTVTRDFGRRVLIEKRAETVPGGETVMRFLQRYAEVDTGYGGRFVERDRGTALRQPRGRAAGLVLLRERHRGGRGRRGARGRRRATACGGTTATGAPRCGCRPWWARSRSRSCTGRRASGSRSGSTARRTRPTSARRSPSVSTGPVSRPARRRSALHPGTSCCAWWWAGGRTCAVTTRRRSSQEGPAESGVFARVRRGGAGYEIDALDSQGRVVQTLGPGSGIVAATRFEEQQPTWTVSGTDDGGPRPGGAPAGRARAAQPVRGGGHRSTGRWPFRRPRRGRR